MAIRSSSGFSHLRPGVFHISLQKTQHPQTRKWKKGTRNNHGLELAPSARREMFVTLLCSFLCICGLAQACIRAKFPQSHQERWLILSRWTTRPLSPQALASALFCRLPCSVLFCWLLSSVSQRDTLTVTYTHKNECHPLCTNVNMVQKPTQKFSFIDAFQYEISFYLRK